MPGDAPGSESWGSMPLEQLIDLLELTTRQLRKQLEETAMDQAAYHRRYWEHWQQLPEGMTVAAMTRDCEMVCRVLNESVILGTSLREGFSAKQTALIAAIGARRA
jgi:hypothetical protein